LYHSIIHHTTIFFVFLCFSDRASQCYLSNNQLDAQYIYF